MAARAPRPGTAAVSENLTKVSMKECASLEEIEAALKAARSEIADVIRDRQKDILDAQAEMQLLLAEVENIRFSLVEVRLSYYSRFH